MTSRPSATLPTTSSPKSGIATTGLRLSCAVILGAKHQFCVSSPRTIQCYVQIFDFVKSDFQSLLTNIFALFHLLYWNLNFSITLLSPNMVIRVVRFLCKVVNQEWLILIQLRQRLLFLNTEPASRPSCHGLIDIFFCRRAADHRSLGMSRFTYRSHLSRSVALASKSLPAGLTIKTSRLDAQSTGQRWTTWT